jgi:hypothetical protein
MISSRPSLRSGGLRKPWIPASGEAGRTVEGASFPRSYVTEKTRPGVLERKKSLWPLRFSFLPNNHFVFHRNGKIFPGPPLVEDPVFGEAVVSIHN